MWAFTVNSASPAGGLPFIADSNTFHCTYEDNYSANSESESRKCVNVSTSDSASPQVQQTLLDRLNIHDQNIVLLHFTVSSQFRTNRKHGRWGSVQNSMLQQRQHTVCKDFSPQCVKAAVQELSSMFMLDKRFVLLRAGWSNRSCWLVVWSRATAVQSASFHLICGSDISLRLGCDWLVVSLQSKTFGW